MNGYGRLQNDGYLSSRNTPSEGFISLDSFERSNIETDIFFKKSKDGFWYAEYYALEMTNNIHMALETNHILGKRELEKYINSLSYFTVNENEYSIKPSSVIKIQQALSSVWSTDTKEWYEKDYTIIFLTTKVDLEKVLCEVDTLIQIKRVQIFGAVT